MRGTYCGTTAPHLAAMLPHHSELSQHYMVHFPKYLDWQWPHVIEMFCQKRFVKHAVVHMEKTLSSNENPLTQDEIICLAQVDFLSDDDEQQKQQNLLVITKLTFRIKTFL